MTQYMNIIKSNNYNKLILKNNYEPYQYTLFQPNIIEYHGQSINVKSSNIITKDKFNSLPDNIKRQYKPYSYKLKNKNKNTSKNTNKTPIKNIQLIKL